MHWVSGPSFALVALASIPVVSAHGYLSGVVSGGKWYKGTDPNWIYAPEKPKQAGWFAYDQDLGFVAPDAYSNDNITCHNGATPGTTSVPVTAGDSIDLQWTPWPDSHHGPVITYLARCPGSCTSVDKTKLNFFKIDQGGLINDATPPGTWASDQLINNNNTRSVTIPSGLSGNFVLRNEIIALHSAENQDGAQNYPMCVNIQISGSGTKHPCKQGAACSRGTALYKANDPGILIDIYSAISSYKIPGPALWSGLKKRAGLVGRSFFA